MYGWWTKVCFLFIHWGPALVLGGCTAQFSESGLSLQWLLQESGLLHGCPNVMLPGNCTSSVAVIIIYRYSGWAIFVHLFHDICLLSDFLEYLLHVQSIFVFFMHNNGVWWYISEWVDQLTLHSEILWELSPL
jgi:hypothetical protein